MEDPGITKERRMKRLMIVLCLMAFGCSEAKDDVDAGADAAADAAVDDTETGDTDVVDAGDDGGPDAG